MFFENLKLVSLVCNSRVMYNLLAKRFPKPFRNFVGFIQKRLSRNLWYNPSYTRNFMQCFSRWLAFSLLAIKWHLNRFPPLIYIGHKISFPNNFSNFSAFYEYNVKSEKSLNKAALIRFIFTCIYRCIHYFARRTKHTMRACTHSAAVDKCSRLRKRLGISYKINNSNIHELREKNKT